MSMVSGSRTVKLLFYSGDVALQCKTQIWCSEDIVVFKLMIYTTVAVLLPVDNISDTTFLTIFKVRVR